MKPHVNVVVIANVANLNSMEPKWILKWNYLGWEKFKDKADYYTQEEWSQTLNTMINQISAQIHMSTLRGPADTLKMNSHILEIVKTFGYYNEENNSVNNKYFIEIDESLNNEILVEFKKELFHVSKCERGETKITEKGEEETELLDVDFISYDKLSDDEVHEFKKKLKGKIIIENYTDDSKITTNKIEQND